MAQARLKHTAPIRLERHPRVVDERRFGDGRVSGALGQLRRQRRGGPVALRHVLDFLPVVCRFVVSVEIVVPHGAAGGKTEPGRFVGYAPGTPSGRGNGLPERHTIVERADFERVPGSARLVREGDRRAVVPVRGHRVPASDAIAIRVPRALDTADRHAITEVYGVHDDAEPGRFDDGAAVPRDAIGETVSRTEGHVEFDAAVGAGDGQGKCGQRLTALRNTVLRAGRRQQREREHHSE